MSHKGFKEPRETKMLAPKIQLEFISEPTGKTNRLTISPCIGSIEYQSLICESNPDPRRILQWIKQKKFDDNAWIPEIILAAPFRVFQCSKVMQWGTFELVYRYPETKLCWGIRGPFVLRCLSSGQFRALFPPQQISTLILTQYVRLVVRIWGPVRFPGFGVR